MKTLFAALLACVVSQVNAQQFTSPMSSIRVTGDAVATAKPDRAVIDVGVLTQEKQSQNAASQNAKQLDAVLAALHKLLGADADIKTINYSLNPDYQYRPMGGKSAVSSYTALNVVRVTVDDLDKVGTVIDAATQAGANHVESVRYTVKDQQMLHSQAVREAATKARANADALASALNLKITRIVSVEEGDAAALGPDAADPRDPAGAAPTPIQSSSFAVTANVTLTVEVSSH
jgi:uncharacterized protein